MRRALATTALVAGAVLGGGAPVLLATPASAEVVLAGDVVLAQGTDVDEPAAQDGDDDTGKYGLIGLTGLFGLFGYKKYRDSRAGTTSRATGGGDLDGDGSGSRRV